MPQLLRDMETALDRVGDMELYTEIVRVFAQSLPETEKALTEAMEKNAWAEARRLAHSLKNNCAAVGAGELRDRVNSLEKACASADEAEARRLFPPLREDLRALREELLAL